MFTKTDNCATTAATRHNIAVTTKQNLYSLAILGSLMIGLILPCLPSHVLAVPLKVTNSAGSWNSGSNWTAVGVPVAGESIELLHAMTVSSDVSFGDDAETSLWSLPLGTNGITVNSGITLTHAFDAGAGSLFLIPSTSTDVRLAGDGTFLNAGNMQMDSAGVLYVGVSGNSNLSNSGTFEFTKHSGRVHLYSGSTRFNNLPGGEVKVNLPSTTDVGRIMGLTDQDGQFVQTGNPINFVQGVLVMAPPNGFGATLDDALFTSLVGAGANPINANSELRLSGGVSDIALTGGTKLDRVKFGSSTDAYNVRSGGSTINVSGTGIKTSDTGSVTINAAAGRALTNQGTFVIEKVSGDLRFNGDGTLDNDSTGTIQHKNALFYLGVGGSPSINNSGLYEFTENGARMNMYSSTTRFNNLPGGTVGVNLPATTSVARIYGQPNVDGQFIQTGNAIDFTQGILVLAPPSGFGGTIDDTLFTSLVGAGANPINANSELRLAGGLNDISLTGGTKLDRVRLGSSTDPIYVRPGGSFIDVSGDGISMANGGSITIATGAGRVLTNKGKLVFDTSAGDVRMNGTGSLDNMGTIEHRNKLLYVNVAAGSNAVNNSGLYEFTASATTVNLYAANAAFNNLADGTLRANLTAAGSLAQFTHSLAGVATFSNLGTVESTGGILRVANNITIPQLTATSLTGGTWKVLSGSVDATLDLLASGTSPGSVDTIGAAAKVVLGGATAQFNQLSSTTLNVDGTFGVQDQQVYNLSTGLNMGAGGILEFGLEGVDEGGTLTTGIDVDGNVTFDGSQVDILNLGGLGVGTYRIMEFVSASDLASLGDVPEGFGFSLAQGDDFLELNVIDLPEPSSMTLLGLGVFVLLRRSRRGKHNA